MLTVTEHDRLIRTYRQLGKYLPQHERIRFACSLISAASRIEVREQIVLTKHPVEPSTALAGGDR